MYEMRERIWIREKTEFEQRHKETIEKWQRSIADLRAQHESDRERAVRAERERCAKAGPNGNNGPTRAEMEKVERHIVSAFDKINNFSMPFILDSSKSYN